MHYSHTSLQTYQTCPRMYEHKYINGWVPKADRVSASIGKAFHCFLAEWRRDWNGDAAMSALLTYLRSIDRGPMPVADIETLEIETERVSAMALGYLRRYADDRTMGKCLIEQEIRVPQTFMLRYDPNVERQDYLAILDCLIMEHGTHPLVIESKTAAQRFVNDAYWTMLKIDRQTTGYAVAVSSLCNLIGPVDVMRDVVVKSQHRIGKAETPAQFGARLRDLYTGEEADGLYQRQTVTKTNKDQLDWISQTEAIMDSIDQPGAWSMNTQQCLGQFGKPCSYLSICTTGEVGPDFKQREPAVVNDQEDNGDE